MFLKSIQSAYLTQGLIFMGPTLMTGCHPQLGFRMKFLPRNGRVLLRVPNELEPEGKFYLGNGCGRRLLHEWIWFELNLLDGLQVLDHFVGILSSKLSVEVKAEPMGSASVDEFGLEG